MGEDVLDCLIIGGALPGLRGLFTSAATVGAHVSSIAAKAAPRSSPRGTITRVSKASADPICCAACAIKRSSTAP